jgi:nucleoside-diphosphate-sugar epimerase
MDDSFSVISPRKGTVCGYSPRMRLDLIVNTMFKSALKDGVITVNNPAIWRPILSIQDAAAAYIRAIEAHQGISGIFNVASGNYTVGEIADLVKMALEQQMGLKVGLNIKHVHDFRNYKVSIAKAANILSFHPHDDVNSIVADLVEHRAKFDDWDNPLYYNIHTFKRLEAGAPVRQPVRVVGASD